MTHSGRTINAGKDDYRVITDTPESQAIQAFYNHREKVESIMRQKVEAENTELVNFAIFQSVLKNLLKDLLANRDSIPNGVIDVVVRFVEELDTRTDPSSRFVDASVEYSLDRALSYRFKNKKNLLETLLESGYSDLSETSRVNLEHVKKLHVAAKLPIPDHVESCLMRLVGYSKRLLSYSGTASGIMRDSMEAFRENVRAGKGVNALIGSGTTTLFKVLLGHLADPQNSEVAADALNLMVEELSVFTDESGFVDPDAYYRASEDCERIIDERFDLLLGHPNKYSLDQLRNYRKFALDWLAYARSIRDASLQTHKEEPEPASVTRTRKNYERFADHDPLTAKGATIA